MTSSNHLTCLFVSTAGQNGENLGSDETQIVLFVYLLYDVSNNKIVTLQQHYVRPALEDIGENILTEECRIQTGLDEDAIRNAQPLEQVLDEFDRFISSKEVHPSNSGKPFTFICDGQLHLRLCLHPEACRKNLGLSQYQSKFMDLRKHFKKFYKVEVVNCIKDMLEFLSIEETDQSVDYGVRHCQDMANIIQRLINDGHVFNEVEYVRDRLEPGICMQDTVVDEDTVIRARGLPWQSSDQDIARFFRGLNVAKGGVALCLSQQGRRNGEALIRFESKEHRDLALRKHKHHLGQRYIEVYRASGKDFIAVAGGSNTEAQQFLSRHGDEGIQVIVRMRGLPYSCTTEQVLDFFKNGDPPCAVLDDEEGILFVHQADGRATGDAFVLFPNDTEANKALAKHRQCIGTRYIELFKSTTAEVQQVLNRSMDPRPTTEIVNGDSMTCQLNGLIPHLPGSLTLNNGGLQPTSASGMMLPQQLITSGTQKDCIRLRGLPFEATVQDILTFLGEYARNIVFQGVHMVYNAQGTPSGEAFIQMDSDQSAELSALTKHKKFMLIQGKKRYIEVIQCSGEDMNLVLTNGLSGLNALNAMSGLSNVVPSSNISPTGSIHTPTGLTSPHMLPHAQPHHRPLISPGGTVFPTGLAGTNPAAAAAAAAYPGLIPYGQLPQGLTMAPGGVAGVTMAGTSNYNPAMASMAAAAAASMMVPSSMAAIPQAASAAAAAAGGFTHLSPRTAMTAASGGAGYPYSQPILYWYPSPPVSPQSSAYYVHGGPTTVVMKGVPFNAQLHELLGFFEGIYEMTPDIQVQRGPDGRPNGEAYVTFGTRQEAERAVTERNRKLLQNRFVEMHMA